MEIERDMGGWVGGGVKEVPDIATALAQQLERGMILQQLGFCFFLPERRWSTRLAGTRQRQDRQLSLVWRWEVSGLSRTRRRKEHVASQALCDAIKTSGTFIDSLSGVRVSSRRHKWVFNMSFLLKAKHRPCSSKMSGSYFTVSHFCDDSLLN